jgi:hypothetical protein
MDGEVRHGTQEDELVALIADVHKSTSEAVELRSKSRELRARWEKNDTELRTVAMAVGANSLNKVEARRLPHLVGADLVFTASAANLLHALSRRRLLGPQPLNRTDDTLPRGELGKPLPGRHELVAQLLDDTKSFRRLFGAGRFPHRMAFASQASAAWSKTLSR